MNPTRSDFTSSKPNTFDVPKVRLRHHSLMQDYRELHMDTEAMRKRLQTIRERKATLMAEVRFLRRRYRDLREDQPLVMHPPPDVKKVIKRSNCEKKSQSQIRVASSDMRSDVESKHVSLPDLNHTESVNEETKTSLKKIVPLFDLNQISGEEETQNNEEESSSCKRMSNIEMENKKLFSCKNGGNGSHKRKISWQDPVAALKV